MLPKKFVRISLFIQYFLFNDLEKCSKSESGGIPGDGDGTKGNCDNGKHCYPDSFCSDKCSKRASGGTAGDGDGSGRGNCDGVNDICKDDGRCEGIYYYK